MPSVNVVLDCIRWTAALLVASSHCRNFLMVDWAKVSDRGALVAAFYWLTGFGRIAVLVFFVLSGYLVGGRALEAIESGRFDARDYAIQRCARLYPPLLAALALTALLDCAGLHYLNRFGFYDFPNTYHIAGESYPISMALGFVNAGLNLLFLQTIAAPTFGSNTPLWSLANEFCYYLAGPLLAIALWRVLPRRGVLVLAIPLVVGAGVVLRADMVTLFGAWLAGALAYHHGGALRPKAVAGAAAVFLAVISVARTIHVPANSAILADLAIGASFAVLLWALGRPGRDAPPGRLASAARRLAGFSYSLYLVHVPIGFLCAAAALQILARPVRLQPGATGGLLFGASLLLAIAVAYLLSGYTEARVGEFRRWLHERLPGGTPRSARQVES